jgi:hypothetical protein
MAEYSYDSMPVNWEDILFLWDEPWLILEEVSNIITSGAAFPRTRKIRRAKDIYDKLGDEKKIKKLIRIVCLVKGYKYDETKEVKDINITLADITETILEVKKHVTVTLCQ